jgi:DNA-binding CsgD family transcriptional regulator
MIMTDEQVRELLKKADEVFQRLTPEAQREHITAKAAARAAAIYHMRKDGYAYAEIAARFGVSPSRARQIVERHKRTLERDAMKAAELRKGVGLDTPMVLLDLSVRSHHLVVNSLHGGWEATIRDVLKEGWRELLRYPNFGRRSLMEIQTAIKPYELTEWGETDEEISQRYGQ